MKKKIFIENVGETEITDKDYIGAGGEAEIFKKGSLALKIFFDPKKAIEEKKMEELGKISAQNVLKPLNRIFEKNKPVGYTMNYLPNTDPICKLFTKSFKANNNMTNNDIIDIVKHMQKTVKEIHAADCLVVDLNELNVMVDITKNYSYFIDVDSYQTKSFHATAIMEAIRDRLVKNNQWTQNSDWFSFAIIAFQMYIGIHPYKGVHPRYKPNEWTKRMDDNVSVFDKQVSLPAVCNSFKVIPKKHLEWMKEVFQFNQRDIPPDIDASIPIVVPEQIIVIKGNEQLEIINISTIKENILRFYNFFGINYFVTKCGVFKDNSPVMTDLKDFHRVELLQSNVNKILVAKLKNKNVTVEDFNGNNVLTVQSNDMMVYEDVLYTYNHNGLFQNTFLDVNDQKVVPSIKKIGNVSEYTTKMYDGVIYQNLLGKHWLIFPIDNRIIYGEIKELAGYRVLDMERKKHICIVMAEKGGVYSQFIICLETGKLSLTYKVRQIDNISYDSINFTVLDNGICAMLDSVAQELVLFRDLKQSKGIKNKAIDASTKLYSFGNKVYIIENKSLYSVTMK